MFEALAFGCGLAVGFLGFLMMSSRAPAARRVANKQRKGNEAREYILVTCRLDGEDLALLLTQVEVDKGIDRAMNHPEDLWGKK